MNEFGDNLSSLVIGRLFHILLHSNPSDPLAMPINHLNLLHIPNLRRLTVGEVYTSARFFPLLLKPLPNLVHLDLSGCRDLGDLSYLCKMENLRSLVLHNVEDMLNEKISTCMLKKLWCFCLAVPPPPTPPQIFWKCGGIASHHQLLFFTPVAALGSYSSCSHNSSVFSTEEDAGCDLSLVGGPLSHVRGASEPPTFSCRLALPSPPYLPQLQP